MKNFLSRNWKILPIFFIALAFAARLVPVSSTPDNSVPEALVAEVTKEYSEYDCRHAPSNGEYLVEAANKGNQYAQYQLGEDYLLGSATDGIEKDTAEGIKWLKKAADNDPDVGISHYAQMELGVIYSKYTGKRPLPQTSEAAATLKRGNTAPDYTEAAKWLRKAAEYGDEWAQYRLGILYRDGLGVPQDFEESYFWTGLSNAASDDNNPGELNRMEPAAKDTAMETIALLAEDTASIVKHLTPGQVQSVSARIQKWTEKEQEQEREDEAKAIMWERDKNIDVINFHGLLCGKSDPRGWEVIASCEGVAFLSQDLETTVSDVIDYYVDINKAVKSTYTNIPDGGVRPWAEWKCPTEPAFEEIDSLYKRARLKDQLKRKLYPQMDKEAGPN